MRYVTDFPFINPSPGVAGFFSLRANAIHEPLTGDASQPYGHDTLQTVYGRNKVISSKITVTFSSPGTGATAVGLGSLQLSTILVPTTDKNLLLEQPETTWKTITGNDQYPRTLTKHYNAAQFFGKNRNKDLTANFGSLPAEIAWFHIGVQSMDPAQTHAKVFCHSVITFKVLVTEPLALGAS